LQHSATGCYHSQEGLAVGHSLLCLYSLAIDQLCRGQ
jgi:hypothetical protein